MRWRLCWDQTNQEKCMVLRREARDMIKNSIQYTVTHIFWDPALKIWIEINLEILTPHRIFFQIYHLIRDAVLRFTFLWFFSVLIHYHDFIIFYWNILTVVPSKFNRKGHWVRTYITLTHLLRQNSQMNLKTLCRHISSIAPRP